MKKFLVGILVISMMATAAFADFTRSSVFVPVAVWESTVTVTDESGEEVEVSVSVGDDSEAESAEGPALIITYPEEEKPEALVYKVYSDLVDAGSVAEYAKQLKFEAFGAVDLETADPVVVFHVRANSIAMETLYGVETAVVLENIYGLEASSGDATIFTPDNQAGEYTSYTVSEDGKSISVPVTIGKNGAFILLIPKDAE